MSNAHELQKQIMQTEAALNELREKLNQEQNAERNQALASAKELIHKYNLSAAELGLSAAGGKSKSKAEKQSKRTGGSPVKPKYMDPSTGITWTGRGRLPIWLATHVSAGKRREDYLIAPVQ